MALVLLGRGHRNRKTIARAICPTPIRTDEGTPIEGLGEGPNGSVEMWFGEKNWTADPGAPNGGCPASLRGTFGHAVCL
jgi:hypothetical protein